MLNAQPSQFKLLDDGQIAYQKALNNPVPGAPVAKLIKGESALAPKVEAQDPAAQEFLQTWVNAHIAEVLAVLVSLQEREGLAAPVAGICERAYEAMGIVPRESLEDLIKDLDADMRASLRAKNIRLGPVLVFMPELNKPAAVRLRGLLWALWNGQALPAGVPNDGVVSVKVEGGDPAFYQAIGYPLYGPRAIRIDMLDRVISAVYDSAEHGKFQAQHKMAEWLGSSIEDLYAVLEAMGHTKVYDPAEEAEKAEAEKLAAAVEAAKEEPKAEEAAAAEDKPAEEPSSESKPQEQVKPELATFRLKKGKAGSSAGDKTPRKDKPKKDYKKDKKSKGKGKPKRDQGPRVITAAAKKVEDSPFAVLQQLKK